MGCKEFWLENVYDNPAPKQALVIFLSHLGNWKLGFSAPHADRCALQRGEEGVFLFIFCIQPNYAALGENGEVHASAARKDERLWKRARRRTLIKKRNAIWCIFVLLQAAAVRARECMRLGRRRGARDEGVAYPASRRRGPLWLFLSLQSSPVAIAADAQNAKCKMHVHARDHASIIITRIIVRALAAH